MKIPQLNRLPRTVELVQLSHAQAEFVYVDQRKLPQSLVFERTKDWRVVVEAIKTLALRGAPAIGVAGAAAVALWAVNEGAPAARKHAAEQAALWFGAELASVAQAVATARPTAVNLAWAVERMVALASKRAQAGDAPEAVAQALFDEVKQLEREDEAANRALGQHGAELLPTKAHVLTHCNAGSLATVFYGTALGVVYAAAAQGKIQHVYADETRPVGQGARLTAWELGQAGISTTLICDNMAASLMAQGEVDAVVVGADRIAANGDTANKIGTYGLAVLAQYHHIPFYVAAPTSTIDASIPTGDAIPIEERDVSEVARVIPEGVEVWNPAFDVTPAHLITAFITEQGISASATLG